VPNNANVPFGASADILRAAEERSVVQSDVNVLLSGMMAVSNYAGSLIVILRSKRLPDDLEMLWKTPVTAEPREDVPRCLTEFVL
jgi:hypothetical protein